MLNVKVHVSTIWKRLKKYGTFGRVARKKSFLSKRNMATRLRLAEHHLNKTQDFWNDVLLTDKTKVQMLVHIAQHHIRTNPNASCEHKHLIPTVKHGGGFLMI